jgi:hypothetical protein
MALSAAAAPSRPGTLTPTRLGASHAPPTRRRCGWCACSGTTLSIAAHISRSYHDHFPSSKWSHNLLQVRAAAVYPRAALTLLLGDALLASRQPGGALADAAESEAARCERRPGAASQAVRHCFSNPVARPTLTTCSRAACDATNATGSLGFIRCVARCRRPTMSCCRPSTTAT